MRLLSAPRPTAVRSGARRPRRRLGLWASLLAVPLLAGCGYATMQQLEEQAQAARNEIEVQLQRRSQLVPSLIETIAAQGPVDAAIGEQLAQARAELVAALGSGELGRIEAASSRLSQGLDRLLAAAERYPRLGSDPGFRVLRSQLETTEDEIERASTNYNRAVVHYNSYIEGFPQAVIAKVVGAKPLETLAPEPAAPPAERPGS